MPGRYSHYFALARGMGLNYIQAGQYAGQMVFGPPAAGQPTAQPGVPHPTMTVEQVAAKMGTPPIPAPAPVKAVPPPSPIEKQVETARAGKAKDIIKTKPDLIGVRPTTGKDIYTVRVQLPGADTGIYRQVRMTAQEMGEAGYKIPLAAQRGMELGQIGGVKGAEAVEKRKREHAGIDDIAELFGVDNKTADTMLQQFKKNPESPTYQTLDADEYSILANAVRKPELYNAWLERTFVEVGVKTDTTEYIRKHEAEKIKKDNPELYKVLINRGHEAYRQASIEQRLKDYPLFVQHEYKKGGEDAFYKAIDKYNESIQRFMDSSSAAQRKKSEELREADPYLWQKYQEGGIEAFTEAAAKRATDLAGIRERLLEKQLASAPEALRQAYQDGLKKTGTIDGGLEAYDKAYKKWEVANQAVIEREKKALNILQPYTNSGGSVDIYGFLGDIEKAKRGKSLYEQALEHPRSPEWLRVKWEYEGATALEGYDGEQILRDAGFIDKDIKEASADAKLYPEQRMWRGLTPWSEAKGEKATPMGAITMAGELIVPGVYVARHWKDLSTTEKIIYIGLDALIFAGPVAKGAALAGRGAAGYATRVGVTAAALRGGIGEMGRVLAAPVNMILHPIEGVKYTVRDVRNLVENIASRKKLPAMSIHTSEGTVRLSIKGEMTQARAVAFRDKLMDAVTQGERVFVRIGKQTIELRRSPLMKELKGSITHATPEGGVFDDVLKVTKKPGMPASEQGLFVSPDPLPRFAEASAFGKTGAQPTIYVMSPETAAKTVTTGKVYKSPVGAVVEMEKKLPVAEVTKGTGQKLYTRVGPMGTRVEIWLEKGVTLSRAQIVKLKAKGLVEWAKAPFTPALKISGKGTVTGLTEKQVFTLSRILRRAGAPREARELLRAERLIRSGRYAVPQMGRIVRVTNDQVKRAKAELEEELASRYRRPTRRVARRVIPVNQLARIQRAMPRREPPRRPVRVDRLPRPPRRPARPERVPRVPPPRVPPPRVPPPRVPPPRVPPPRVPPPRVPPPRVPPPRVPPPRVPPPAGASDKEEREYLKSVRGFIARRRGQLNIPISKEVPRKVDGSYDKYWYRKYNPPDNNAPDATKRKYLDKLPSYKSQSGGKDKGQDVWLINYWPYGEQDKLVLIGKPPAGAKRVTGKGSLQKSAVLLRGEPPSKPIYSDTGAVDDIITADGRKIIVKSVKDVGKPEKEKQPRIKPLRVRAIDVGGGIEEDNKGRRHIKL